VVKYRRPVQSGCTLSIMTPEIKNVRRYKKLNCRTIPKQIANIKMKYQKLDMLLLKTTGRTEMVKPTLFNRQLKGF
jgi:hypothetical protein